MVGLIDDESEISSDIKIVTGDLLAKRGAWTYASYYRGLHPKHDANNTYTFNGMQYTNVKKTTDCSGVTTSTPEKHDYKLPTRYLTSETVNCSDLVMGCGYGISTIRGSGMYLMNKYIPKEMRLWYEQQSDEFKHIFTLSDSAEAQNYLSIYRPFLPNISIDNVNVSCDDLLKQPFSFAGNRSPEQGLLKCE